MLLSQLRKFVIINIHNLNWVQIGNDIWIRSNARRNCPSSGHISQKILISKFLRALHEIILQKLKVVSTRTKTIALISNKRRFKLVRCIQEQRLAVLYQDIKEVAVWIQVRNHDCFREEVVAKQLLMVNPS